MILTSLSSPTATAAALPPRASGRARRLPPPAPSPLRSSLPASPAPAAGLAQVTLAAAAPGPSPPGAPLTRDGEAPGGALRWRRSCAGGGRLWAAASSLATGWRHPPGPDLRAHLGLGGPAAGHGSAWLSGGGGGASGWWWMAARLPACSSAVAGALRVAWFASVAGVRTAIHVGAGGKGLRRDGGGGGSLPCGSRPRRRTLLGSYLLTSWWCSQQGGMDGSKTMVARACGWQDGCMAPVRVAVQEKSQSVHPASTR